MPADTFSSLLGILLMGTGNDNNTWGANANAAVFQALEQAICDQATYTVSGGTLDLSGSAPPTGLSQTIAFRQKFVGTLTSNQTVIVPANRKFFMVGNGVSGGHSLLIKTPGGVATEIPNNTNKLCYCDGANILRMDSSEVGMYADFPTTAVPGGYLECDGSVLNIADHPDLFAVLSTTYGGNGITTFGLPNLKDTGRYRRSRTASTTPSTTQGNQFASHTHTGSVTVSGTGPTGGQSQTHTHSVTLNDPGHTHNFSPGVNTNVLCTASGSDVASPGSGKSFEGLSIASASTGITVSSVGNASQDHTHSVSLSSSGSFTTDATGGTAETRPETMIVLTCIKL